MMKNSVVTKRAAMPYGGMAGRVPLMQPLPAPPVQQPIPQQGQQAAGAAPMVPPQPSVAAQAGGMSGGRQQRGYGNTPLKQNSGAVGTPGRPPVGTKKSAGAPVPSNTEMPGLQMPPKRPFMPQLAMPPRPVGGQGMQSLAVPRPSGRNLMEMMMKDLPKPVSPSLPLGKAGNAYCGPMMSVTGPLSGSGPAGVGMKPPAMTAPMAPMSGMNAITGNVGAAIKTGNHACYPGTMPKKPKKPAPKIKKANLLTPQLDRELQDMVRPSGMQGLPTALVGAGAGMGLNGASLGSALGGLAGAIHGSAKGNMAEGLGRGVVRGAGTGAGVGIGGLLGGLAGGSLGGIDGAALGGLAGAGLGGVGGWNAAGHLMGESSTDKLKKEKDKTDQEKGRE